jgi:polyhydroxyalkanoate synthesis repressor PhaR
VAIDSSDDPSKRLRIRKYPNRRYYDSTQSRHLTLSEIYEKIREGYEIEVRDSKTGADITAKVLAQIIIDLDAPKLGVFPVPMLHRLLRTNEKLAMGFFDTFFSQPLSAYLNSHRSAEQYFRHAMGLRSPAGTEPERSAPQPESSDNDLRAMIDDLRSQLRELRSATRGAGTPARRRKPSSRRSGKTR